MVNIKKLTVQVEAVNQLTTFKKMAIPYYLEQLKQYVGKRMLTQNGISKTTPITVMPDYIVSEGDKYVNGHSWVTNEYRYIYVELKVRVTISGKTEYETATVAIGEFNEDNTLKPVKDLENIVSLTLPQPYTVDGVKTLIEAYKVKEKELEDAKRAIPYSIADTLAYH